MPAVAPSSSGAIAGSPCSATPPPSGRAYGVVQALRQTLGAAVRWGYMASNPAVIAERNRQPSPRVVRVYARAERDAIAAELTPAYRATPTRR